jgi:type I restriction enzyme S subunit
VSGSVALRRIVRCLDGKRVPLNREERGDIPGDYPYWGANGVVDTVGDYLFDEDLVLLGEDGAPFGDPSKDVAFRADGKIWVNNHIHVLRPTGVDSRFLTYALNCVDWVPLISGSTRDKLTQDDMMRARIPAWDLAEQRAIAEFLDTETARIDALIAKKRRMIDALEEQFVAWREQEMVLGIDVTWVPLMHLTDPCRPIVYGIVQAGDEWPGGVPYIKTGDLTDFDPNALSLTSPEIDATYRRARVHPGDIVIAMRASIGLPIVVPSSLPAANLTQGTARVAAGAGIETRWLYQVLRTNAVQEQCDVRAVGSTFRTLNIWDLRRISVPVPSRLSQLDVAQRVDSRERVHGTLSRRLTTQIDRLVEHRKALITAAVTGELAVPGVAA